MMDDMLLMRQLSTPITTGITQTLPTDLTQTVPKESFRELLNTKLENDPDETCVNFSRHAMNRVIERGIDISEERLNRLNEGVRLAEEKGLNDTLIIVDSAAYIVNVRNNTVITTVGGDEVQGNVFTHIDGTVII